MLRVLYIYFFLTQNEWINIPLSRGYVRSPKGHYHPCLFMCAFSFYYMGLREDLVEIPYLSKTNPQSIKGMSNLI